MVLALTPTRRWLDGSESEKAALADIQGNILDGQSRKATRHVFLQIGENAAASRAFIRELAPQITSTLKHLAEAKSSLRRSPTWAPFKAIRRRRSGGTQTHGRAQPKMAIAARRRLRGR